MNVDRFSLPLARSLTTARGEITDREGFLVTVESDGERGLGEATPLPGWTESIDACEAALEAVTDPDAALSDLPPAARHGVSLALADARARAAGVPLYRYLGREEGVEAVPVNATVGDGPVDETVAAVEAVVDAGYPAAKVKVGARPVAEDVDRLRAVRSACPDVELRADANGAWTRREAERAFDALADLGLAYVEQPLPAADLEGHATLRGDVRVALDESLAERGVDAVLDADAADVLVLKPMVLGGPDRAVEAARLVSDAGLEPVVTTTVDGAVARAAAVHVAAAIPDVPPCGLATGDRLAADLLGSDPSPVADGAASPGQKEGNIPPSSTGDYA